MFVVDLPAPHSVDLPGLITYVGTLVEDLVAVAAVGADRLRPALTRPT